MADQWESIEVVVSWGGNPLDTALVTDRALRIGPSSEAWMTLPAELLAVDHSLVEPIDDGWVLRVPAAAELKVARDGRALEPESVARVFGGERHVRLEAGLSAEVRLGDFAFFVRSTERVTERTPKTAAGWRWTRWLAVAAVLHGIVLALFALTPSSSAALNLDGRADMSRYVQISTAAMAHEDPPVETVAVDAGGSRSDSAGSQGGGESATVVEGGSPAPRRAGRRTPSFVPSADNLHGIGALAVLERQIASFGDGSSPYTAGSAQEGTGGLANGQALLAAGPGWGALDLGGTGVGTCDPRTQDCTAGMVGVGELDTHGDPGHGHSVSLRDRDHVSRVPTIRTPITETTGALSAEQVRRVIRRHVNEVRFCYEQGLQSRPDLEGRVAVSFIIGSNGTVANSSLASNTVNDARVGSCVQQAVTRWTFPAASSPTGVTYPFLMQSH